MAFRDREMLADLFKAYCCNGFEFFGLQARLSQLRGTRHREATRVRGSQQLFGISADTALKSRAERILRLLQDPALSRQQSLSAFHIALPNSRSFAFHLAPLSVRPGFSWHLNCHDLS